MRNNKRDRDIRTEARRMNEGQDTTEMNLKQTLAGQCGRNAAGKGPN